MTQQNKLVDGDVDGTQDRYTTRRRARLERRAARRADRYTGGWGWLGGILLIALGLLFMAQNAGYFSDFSNWWALFLLLPAASTFSAGFGAYRRNGGRWTKEATGPVLASLLFLGLTIVFLFNLDFNLFGPLLLIAGGLLLIFAPR